MRDQIPVQFNHYPLIVYHHRHPLHHSGFQVFCKMVVGVAKKLDESVDEPVDEPTSAEKPLGANIS